jgi:hypothetical protein
MDRMRASFLFEDWADYVLNVEGGFKDLTAGETSEAATSESDTDEDAPAPDPDAGA